MPNIKQIKSNEESLKTIGDFFSAYQKLTIYQMQKNRDATIASRTFFQGLLNTFVDLKQDLKHLFESDKKNKDVISFSTLTKNGKTVSVLLSFETKFSTQTNRETFELFEKSIKDKTTDVVIVGATAKRLFTEFFHKDKTYKYFELKEENSNLKNNIPLMKHLLKYEEIDIYNPFYVSLMKQQPQMATISGDLSAKNEKVETSRERNHFLIEPDKKKLLSFFEIQIMSSLFQNKIKEAHLATLGSRISTLQNTQDNLEIEMEKLKRLKLKTLKYKANKKQRNRLSSMRFW